MTFVHHIYGGIIYHTPDRIYGALAFTLFFVITVWMYAWRSRAWARRIFWALVFAFWVIMIGVYEGGYNHTLYLALWYGEADHQLLHTVYPNGGEVVEPTSFIFEATGVMTFVFACMLAIKSLQIIRKRGKNT